MERTEGTGETPDTATTGSLTANGVVSSEAPVVDDSPPADDFQPADYYTKYFARGEAGDLDAQYVLVVALSDCLTVVKSEQQLQTDVIQAGFSERVIEQETSRFLKCKPLLESIPDIQAEHDYWYQSVQAARHPLVLVKQQNRPFAEARELVLFAITERYPEPFLYYDVYLAAARLHVEYPSERFDETRFSAWQALACSVGIECDYETMTEMMRTQFSPSHYEEVVRVETALADAIRRRDFDALGL